MSDQQLFLRASSLELADDNTVVGLITPFDTPATVVDKHPDTGQVSKFTEVFRRGAFAKMVTGLKARGWMNAISLNLDHNTDVGHTIGFATDVEERDDGAWGTFSLYDDTNLDKVKSMLRSSHRGMSVGFLDKKHRVSNGVVERLVVHLHHVAATPIPTYAGAGVTSVRASDLLDFDDDDVATPNLDALRDDLEALRH